MTEREIDETVQLFLRLIAVQVEFRVRLVGELHGADLRLGRTDSQRVHHVRHELAYVVEVTRANRARSVDDKQKVDVLELRNKEGSIIANRTTIRRRRAAAAVDLAPGNDLVVVGGGVGAEQL